MVYKVPAAKSALPENRFEFEIGDAVHSVPKMEFANGATLDVYDKMTKIDDDNVSIEDATLIYKIFEAANPIVGAAVRSLEPEQAFALFQAWSEAGDLDAPKSSGSEESSTSTEKQ